jgi:hypothetical protein
MALFSILLQALAIVGTWSTCFSLSPAVEEQLRELRTKYVIFIQNTTINYVHNLI